MCGIERKNQIPIPCAPLARGVFCDAVPRVSPCSRVSPFAITVGPVVAGHLQFVDTVKFTHTRSTARPTMPKAWTVKVQGGAQRNPGMPECKNQIPMPTAWTLIAQCEARNERNPGDRPENVNRPNGADGDVFMVLDYRDGDIPCAPLGRYVFCVCIPRVSPWAINVGPVGARCTKFATFLRVEQAIKAKLRGIGYGG